MPGSRRSSPPSRVLLGVTGGIAAYKSLELVRLFRKRGWEVQVVMTRHATEILGPESFRALSGRAVATGLFPEHRPVQADVRIEHIDLAQWADLVLVAPATANIIGKLAGGIADDLLSTLLLAVPRDRLDAGRVLFAPAMNTHMWQHASVQRNVAMLRTQGYRFVEPEPGDLACGQQGPGRLADPTDIFFACSAALAGDRPLPDLSDARVLVTTGRTEEPIDPVRIVTNRSSGAMGVAIARAFRLARAQVHLVSGAVSVPLPAGVPTTIAGTAEEMRDAVVSRATGTDVLVMCAAVSDYRPAKAAKGKRREARLELALERTPDILTTVNQTGCRALLVGFSHDPSPAVARSKLKSKKLDLIVANPFATAGADTIKATLIPCRGRTRSLPEMPKQEFALHLAAEVGRLLEARK